LLGVGPLRLRTTLFFAAVSCRDKKSEKLFEFAFLGTSKREATWLFSSSKPLATRRSATVILEYEPAICCRCSTCAACRWRKLSNACCSKRFEGRSCSLHHLSLFCDIRFGPRFTGAALPGRCAPFSSGTGTADIGRPPRCFGLAVVGLASLPAGSPDPMPLSFIPFPDSRGGGSSSSIVIIVDILGESGRPMPSSEACLLCGASLKKQSKMPLHNLQRS